GEGKDGALVRCRLRDDDDRAVGGREDAAFGVVEDLAEGGQADFSSRPRRLARRATRSRGTIVGLTFSSTTSRVTSTRAMSGLLGTSYMTERRTSSRIARRPRAPVPRRIA